MTRVYQADSVSQGLRVLVVGAGYYPYRPNTKPTVPRYGQLNSVAPSIFAFLKQLMGPWRQTLTMPLLSVDLALSDPDKPLGATWPGLGVDGEPETGVAIEPATLAVVKKALDDALAGATPEDGLLLFFCGHGFSRASRYFVLSDFGTETNPWSQLVDLDGLKLGLRQEPPRTQWLFWDCCADITKESTEVLSRLGDPLLAPSAGALAFAATNYGTLSQFGAASASIGLQAFAMPHKPSRFTEMLIDALEMAGATKRQGGVWWVNDRGIMDALSTYAQRNAHLPDAAFYDFVTPFSTDAPGLIRFRSLEAPPSSTLLARSKPDQAALKAATVSVQRERAAVGEPPVYEQPPKPKSSLLRLSLAPFETYTVTVQFAGTDKVYTESRFADLPFAEELELRSP